MSSILKPTFQLSLSSLRTCIEHWENGVAWINEGDQVITHHTVPFKSLESSDFSHVLMRDKFNKCLDFIAFKHLPCTLL